MSRGILLPLCNPLIGCLPHNVSEVGRKSPCHENGAVNSDTLRNIKAVLQALDLLVNGDTAADVDAEDMRGIGLIIQAAHTALEYELEMAEGKGGAE
jgi:hypothetical protein